MIDLADALALIEQTATPLPPRRQLGRHGAHIDGRASLPPWPLASRARAALWAALAAHEPAEHAIDITASVDSIGT